jgi:predicted CoA-binding protein
MADPKTVLEQADTVAVVGMSTDPGKPSNHIPAELRDHGFRVIPVHPGADEILGEQAYPSLADVPVPVDVVEVFRPSEEAPDIAREAVAIGAKALWLQRGITSPEARRIAEEAGLDYVEDHCMGVERRRFGIEKP